MVPRNIQDDGTQFLSTESARTWVDSEPTSTIHAPPIIIRSVRIANESHSTSTAPAHEATSIETKNAILMIPLLRIGRVASTAARRGRVPPVAASVLTFLPQRLDLAPRHCDGGNIELHSLVRREVIVRDRTDDLLSQPKQNERSIAKRAPESLTYPLSGPKPANHKAARR